MSGEDLGVDHCGAVLAQTRETLGLSLREVSEALHLPIHTVDSLERGNKSQLPAYVFTRGYVNAYARFLELDPDPLLASLKLEYGDAPAAETPRQSTSPDRQVAQVRRLIPWFGAVLALLIVLGLTLTLMDGEPEPQTSESAAADVVPMTTDENPEPAESLDATPADVPEPADAAASDQGTQVVAEPGEDGREVASAEVAQVAAADAAFSGRRLTPAGADRIVLIFNEDSWVEIRDRNDNLLFGDLGRSGQELRFIGAGPFRLLLGYAPGTALLFNDEPVVLGPHTRNDVAALVIGQ